MKNSIKQFLCLGITSLLIVLGLLAMAWPEPVLSFEKTQPVPPSDISLMKENQVVIEINMTTGNIILAPHLTPDEASKLFWEILRKAYVPCEASE